MGLATTISIDSTKYRGGLVPPTGTIASKAYVDAAVAGVTSPVTSVFSRVGVITAQANDYSFTQISGTAANNQLANSSVTVTAGSGLSGGGSVALGSSTSVSLNLGNENAWTAQQDFNGNASLPSGKYILLNGTSDTNWRMGLGINAFTVSTVGATTSIQIVTGTGSGGPDGFAIGGTGGSSMFELNGNTGNAYFRNAVTGAGGFAVSGTNSVPLTHLGVIEYLDPNMRLSLPSTESYSFYNQGRGTNLLMSIDGSTGTVRFGQYGGGVAQFDSSGNISSTTTPVLGTPVSGILTNCTGTASGLTAGNVTTNANLTGPITSVGNTTSIASQTGTGSKFVMDTSPTLVTPALGTPASGTLTNCTFPTLNQNTSGTAANVTGIVLPANGGTGVANNSANTVTFSGNFGLTLTLTGTTSITLPTSGTLATTSQLPTAANPSGTVGVQTVNGSAATFMRSDAAPMLSILLQKQIAQAVTCSILNL